MTGRLASVVLLWLLLTPCWVWAQTLTIPPYIMQTTATGACIRWTTSIGADSLLEYGRDYNNLTETSYSVGPVTDHEECPTGLGADEKWHYRIGYTGTALTTAGPTYYFTTNPTIGSQENTRIWFVSDTHAADKAFNNVKRAYQNFISGHPADIMLAGGDNFGNNATVGEITTTMNSLEEITRHTPFWPAMGNHEIPGQANYFSLMTLPTAGESGGAASSSEGYYSFTYGTVHIIVVNGWKATYPITDGAPGPTSTQYDWIVADLATNTASGIEWLIVVNHYPPYSRGFADSDTEQNMEQIREEALDELEGGRLGSVPRRAQPFL